MLEQPVTNTHEAHAINRKNGGKDDRSKREAAKKARKKEAITMKRRDQYRKYKPRTNKKKQNSVELTK